MATCGRGQHFLIIPAGSSVPCQGQPGKTRSGHPPPESLPRFALQGRSKVDDSSVGTNCYPYSQQQLCPFRSSFYLRNPEKPPDFRPCFAANQKGSGGEGFWPPGVAVWQCCHGDVPTNSRPACLVRARLDLNREQQSPASGLANFPKRTLPLYQPPHLYDIADGKEASRKRMIKSNAVGS